MAPLVMKEYLSSDDRAERDVQALQDVPLTPRAAAIEQLGLHRQRDCTVQAAQRFYGPPLTKEEIRVWTAFLPTSYSRNDAEWGDYRFDELEDEVLDQISTADSMRLFHDLEIWTPEIPQRGLDPMAVGAVYNSRGKAFYFPIVSWGEAYAEFVDIKRAVDLRHRYVVRQTSRVIIALMLIVLTYTSWWIAGEASGGLFGPIVNGVIIFGGWSLLLGFLRIGDRRRVAAQRFPVKPTITVESLTAATA